MYRREGMSSDVEEEIDIFLNECVDEINNRSDDLQIDMNVEDDIDFSSAPAPKKKTTYPKREGKAKQGDLIIHSTSSVY